MAEGQSSTSGTRSIITSLKKFESLTLEGVMLRPGDDESWEEYLALLKKRKYDGIAFGGGVRTIPQLSDYFTQLIRTATSEQPQATLVFPLLPEDIPTAIKKHLPEIK